MFGRWEREAAEAVAGSTAAHLPTAFAALFEGFNAFAFGPELSLAAATFAAAAVVSRGSSSRLFAVAVKEAFGAFSLAGVAGCSASNLMPDGAFLVALARSAAAVARSEEFVVRAPAAEAGAFGTSPLVGPTSARALDAAKSAGKALRGPGFAADPAPGDLLLRKPVPSGAFLAARSHGCARRVVAVAHNFAQSCHFVASCGGLLESSAFGQNTFAGAQHSFAHDLTPVTDHFALFGHGLLEFRFVEARSPALLFGDCLGFFVQH
mmetsp:Transcript_19621/g.38867  ORF Transcript_19621/g.38867 Transcript_19621/m.38867 type:complete len:265 (-) Transcript_19621:639-1433(-)